MGFFTDRLDDNADRRARDAREQTTDPQMPEWLGPPTATMPGVSGQTATIFKTPDVMLVVRGFEAYATGVEFTLELWGRAENARLQLFELLGQRGMAPAESMLLFGVVLADGSAWSNVDLLDRPDDYSWSGDEPAQPTLSPRGGGGDDGHSTMRLWLWPLPPAGPVTFVAEWPERGIPESTAVIAGRELRQAAHASFPIWT